MHGEIDPTFWLSKRVFLTGHTGFKGAWLAYWLHKLGATVTGFSLAPETTPSLFNLLRLDQLIESVIGDIRDLAALRDAMVRAKPDIVLHLAAQPIVSTGYRDPVGTFATNVMGVVNLLEVCRELGGNLAVLVISSDKCYRNNDEGRSFEVGDPLGGSDPYSASKAGTEIVVGAYASSFFKNSNGPVLASARAGNVVGGGDWSLDRLIPDGARAFSRGEALVLRNPMATRPWQHVVEPLFGYLMLVEAMKRDRAFSGPWNFGPTSRNNHTVGALAELFAKSWGQNASVEFTTSEQDWTEAHTLDLNCSMTNKNLGWRPALDLQETVDWTANWYREWYADRSTAAVRALTETQIENYCRRQRDQSQS
jgi:CDP-glucose 4,6-dehydratase